LDAVDINSSSLGDNSGVFLSSKITRAGFTGCLKTSKMPGTLKERSY